MTELTRDNKYIDQPSSIKLALYDHQKTIIAKMLDIETSNKIDIIDNNNKTGKISIDTNLCILGDITGSGKTVDIISLISMKNDILSDNTTTLFKNKFIEYKLTILNDIQIKTNLIITKNSTFKLFENIIQNNTKLSVKSIETEKDLIKILYSPYKNILPKYPSYRMGQQESQKDIINEIDIEKIRNCDVLIITKDIARIIHKLCEKIKFNRLIIDEAENIELNENINFNNNFTWLISNKPESIYNKSQGYVKKISKSIRENIFNSLIIKNKDEFVKQSIGLKPPLINKIMCRHERQIHALINIIPENVMNLINQNDTEAAIKALGCVVNNEQNLIQSITKKINDEIDKYNINLKEYEENNIDTTQIKQLIKKLESKINNIKSKIKEINDTTCTICMGDIEKPTLFTCCSAINCFECIATYYNKNEYPKCSICNTLINKDMIKIIDNNITVLPQKENIELKEKNETIIELINNKPHGSFIIFSDNSRTFYNIENLLIKNNTRYNIVKGSVEEVNRCIYNFNNDNMNIMLMNTEYIAQGINLEKTTDIIFYHIPNESIEKDIIGKAQRIGRNKNNILTIHYLLHENENKEIKNYYDYNNEPKYINNNNFEYKEINYLMENFDNFDILS